MSEDAARYLTTNGLISMFNGCQLIACHSLRDCVVATRVTDGVVGDAVAVPLADLGAAPAIGLPDAMAVRLEEAMHKAFVILMVNAGSAHVDIRIFAPLAEVVSWSETQLGRP